MRRVFGALCGVMLAGSQAAGQGTGIGFEMQRPELPRVVRVEQPTPEQIAQAERQEAIGKELRLIRRQFFGSRDTEIRQIGIAQLRTYTDPEAYPALLETFARDDDDVRTAILDLLASQRTAEADATLAWAAVHDADKAYRELAADRLALRTSQSDGISDRVKLVLIDALQRADEGPPEQASRIARRLRIADLIPYLIAAQAGPARSESERTGDLANIVIGRQIAFISDLQPVVSDSAVGFDPELSVVVEGVVLGISDAVVTSYRPVVHRNLVGLSTDLWGHSTRGFAYDNAEWERWYREEFRPFWIAQQRDAGRDNG